MDKPQKTVQKRVLIFGATGTAGQGTTRALCAAGHNVTCVVRSISAVQHLPDATTRIEADIADSPKAVMQALQDQQFDVVVSCLASRTGSPKDAWRIDHGATQNALRLAKAVKANHFILLSAICVQKPTLPFQDAKLAFEAELIDSGLTYSIVRPTAFFKSLSGQIDRLRKGKPFLIFGDGKLTACTPISDDDLGRFIADCIPNTDHHNKFLPIGGPGPALTPIDMGQELFRLLGKPAKFKRVPVGLLDAIQACLRFAGRFNSKLAEKAELARIGRYYATESMLVLNPETGEYDRDLTPTTGSETLFDHYARIIKNDEVIARGDHSVF